MSIYRRFMHAEDLGALGELAIQAREIVTRLGALAQIPPDDDVRDVRQLVERTARDLATFTEHLQAMELRGWDPALQSRHPPNRWLTAANPPLESKDVDPDAPVTRYDMDGHEAGTVRLGPPPISQMDRGHRRGWRRE